LLRLREQEGSVPRRIASITKNSQPAGKGIQELLSIRELYFACSITIRRIGLPCVNLRRYSDGLFRIELRTNFSFQQIAHSLRLQPPLRDAAVRGQPAVTVKMKSHIGSAYTAA